MRAARWDGDAEIGGVWSTTLHRTADGVTLPVVAPCTMTIWAIGANPLTAAPVKTVAGSVAGGKVAFTLAAGDVTALGIGAHEYRLTVTDPTVGAQVLLRGYLTVRGRVGDL